MINILPSKLASYPCYIFISEAGCDKKNFQWVRALNKGGAWKARVTFTLVFCSIREQRIPRMNLVSNIWFAEESLIYLKSFLDLPHHSFIVSPCANFPCCNGGTCVNEALSYTCDYPSGFVVGRCKSKGQSFYFANCSGMEKELLCSTGSIYLRYLFRTFW